MSDIIKIFIADDKKEICDSLSDNIILSLKKYGVLDNEYKIHTTFTEHAYEHGKIIIDDGLKPDICIFDLVFNGHTGIQLYKYITDTISKKPHLCIYTGVEKTYESRKNAEILSSESDGIVTVIAKPNIQILLSWFENILVTKYNKIKREAVDDPFELL